MHYDFFSGANYIYEIIKVYCLSEDTGVTDGKIFISFTALYQDVRQSIEHQYNTVI